MLSYPPYTLIIKINKIQEMRMKTERAEQER